MTERLRTFRWIKEYSGLQIMAVGFFVAMSGGSLCFLPQYIDRQTPDVLIRHLAHLFYWVSFSIGLFGVIIAFIGLLAAWWSMLSRVLAFTTSLFRGPDSNAPSDN